MPEAAIYWFTGLSGAGKSTVAEGTVELLEKAGLRVLVLDGDDVRARLHKHLGFTPPEIEENNSLIACLCADNRDAYDVILVPIISPYARSRKAARQLLGEGFYEIYFDVDLAVLEERDTKGLYGMARRGEIDNLVGVSSSNTYEPPARPDLTISTGSQKVNQSIFLLHEFIIERYGG